MNRKSQGTLSHLVMIGLFVIGLVSFVNGMSTPVTRVTPQPGVSTAFHTQMPRLVQSTPGTTPTSSKINSKTLETSEMVAWKQRWLAPSSVAFISTVNGNGIEFPYRPHSVEEMEEAVEAIGMGLGLDHLIIQVSCDDYMRKDYVSLQKFKAQNMRIERITRWRVVEWQWDLGEEICFSSLPTLQSPQS